MLDWIGSIPRVRINNITKKDGGKRGGSVKDKVGFRMQRPRGELLREELRSLKGRRGIQELDCMCTERAKPCFPTATFRYTLEHIFAVMELCSDEANSRVQCLVA